MAGFRREEYEGRGRPSGGFNRGSGGRDFGHKSFDVICDKCGKETTVPFEPRNGKPVLCRDCFRGNDSAPMRDEAPRQQIAAVADTAELTADIETLGDLVAESNEATVTELKAIHAKLDKIMKIMNID